MKQRITWAEREQIAARNRALLDEDLREKRLVFESRPYEAHVQFSNVCNMSCIMCWDGNNPPARKMSPAVLERLRTEIAPDLSVITPHDGSEPTVVTWEETVALVSDYSIQLTLTTNGQLFDEQKFHEVKDNVEMILFSIDSHLPDLFEQIRPGADAAKVYENLETVARLCAEHRIELVVQVVFMTVNAPHMPQFFAWLADHGVQVVYVIQLIDVNRHSWYLDATMHFSAEYIDWIKQQCVAVAEERKLFVDWYLSDHESYDFADPERVVRPRESRLVNDQRDTDMRFRHPGFCKYAYDRLRLRADGDVSPCGLDAHGELSLGNLGERGFDEIWNGAAARDLRRAHYTWDYPSICKSCRFVDLLPPQQTLEMLEHYLERAGGVRDLAQPNLSIEAPEHMLRTELAPTIVLRQPAFRFSSYQLVMSAGGLAEGTIAVTLETLATREGALELRMPETVWDSLETNIGYWWAVVARGLQDGQPVVGRTPELRCLIRQEAIPRIEESTLEYPDEGHFAKVYLGGSRQVGWLDRGELPSRPPLRKSTAALVPGKRFARRRTVPAGSTSVAEMSTDAYREVVGHVRDVVANAVPAGALVLVATKGDPELLAVEGRRLRHFPADSDGQYVGYHPPDDEWAIERLEQARADGAQFLVIPATTDWWLDHYRGFAEHLQSLREPIVDDHERCTIFDLRC